MLEALILQRTRRFLRPKRKESADLPASATPARAMLTSAAGGETTASMAAKPGSQQDKQPPQEQQPQEQQPQPKKSSRSKNRARKAATKNTSIDLSKVDDEGWTTVTSPSKNNVKRKKDCADPQQLSPEYVDKRKRQLMCANYGKTHIAEHSPAMDTRALDKRIADGQVTNGKASKFNTDAALVFAVDKLADAVKQSKIYSSCKSNDSLVVFTKIGTIFPKSPEAYVSGRQSCQQDDSKYEDMTFCADSRICAVFQCDSHPPDVTCVSIYPDSGPKFGDELFTISKRERK